LIEGGIPTMDLFSGSPDNQEVIQSLRTMNCFLNPGLLENFPFLGQLAANYVIL
jgi:hypothetical protein